MKGDILWFRVQFHDNVRGTVQEKVCMYVKHVKHVCISDVQEVVCIHVCVCVCVVCVCVCMSCVLCVCACVCMCDMPLRIYVQSKLTHPHLASY